MPAGDYWVGLAFFLVTWGGCAAAGWFAVTRLAPGLAGSMRVLGWALLATGALLIAHLLPAALTVLSREAAALAAMVLALGASRLRTRSPARAIAFPPSAREPTELDRRLARLGVLAFGIWLALIALRQLHAEPLGFDAVNAYLPTAANWIQEGSIWGIQDWLPGFFFGATPGNGTVVLLAATLPWENDFVAHLAIYPFVVLTALSLYALAREAQAPRPAAALIGVMLTAAPVIVFPALRDALLDPVLYSAFSSGLLFLVRHRRTGDQSDLALAGLGLGIAFGAKFYGFTAVPIVVLAWVAASLWSRPSASRLARQALVLLAPIILFGGLWIARNWIETGNPAYPVAINAFGLEVFDAPVDPLRERLGTTLADYVDEPSVWGNELREQFRVAIGLPIAILAVAVVVAGAFLVRRRGLREDDDSDGPALVGVILAVALAASYALTPYSATGGPGDPFLAAANVRYGVPALIVAAAVAAWLCGRLGRAALTGACVVALVGTFDALRVGTLAPRSTVYAAFGLAAVCVGAAWLVRRRAIERPSLPRIGPRLAVGGAAALLILVAVVGSRLQETYNDSRYMGQDEALSALASDESHRVGIAGNWTPEEPGPIYPAFGRRVQNEVSFVGVTEDGLLRRASSRQEFLAALGHPPPDVLLVGLAEATPEDPEALRASPAGAPAELGWAESAGYTEVMRSERFALLSGPRDPGSAQAAAATTNIALPRSLTLASG